MSNATNSNSLKEASSFQNIYSQYASEASFLWLLRSIAIREPHNDNNDIIMLDNRIDEQLKGLLSSMEIGWDACLDALEQDEAGDYFTAMVIAMKSHDATKIKQVVDTGFNSNSIIQGLISAMAWLPADISDSWLERFINGKDLKHKYLGIAACSIRRTDPGKVLVSILKRSDCMQDIRLYSRAIRLVGELRRLDCLPLIDLALTNSNEQVKFWANWSVILLGQHRNVNNLKPYVFKSNLLQDKAIQIAFRVLNITEARDWISTLSQDETQTRAVIKAIGVLGDPHAINWLILKMKEPLYAKLSAESFYLITGIELISAGLTMEVSEDYMEIPNDELDDKFVGLDEDENLPYPDVNKVLTIWQKYANKFIVGKRYFMGNLITNDSLNKTIAAGMQRYRQAAALELALSDYGQPLLNTKSRETLI